MGGPKALLPWRETTFLGAALELFRPLSPVVVVLDPGSPIHAEAVRVATAAGAIVADNPDPDRGMLSSIRRGLTALPASTTHAAILPVDHPGIGRATLDALLAAVEADPSKMVVPSFE